MNNRVAIKGAVTEIILTHKGSEMRCLIDAKDIALADSVSHRWCVMPTVIPDKFYCYCRVDGKTIYLHRLLMGFPMGDVDHINGNGLDNRRSTNLRAVSHHVNQLNRAGAQRNNSNGVRGVFWHKERKLWQAQIKLHGKGKFIGRYQTIEEAERAVISYRKSIGCLA